MSSPDRNKVSHCQAFVPEKEAGKPAFLEWDAPPLTVTYGAK